MTTTNQGLNATITPTPTLTTKLIKYATLSASVTATPTLATEYIQHKTLSASITATPSLTTGFIVSRPTLTATVTPTATMLLRPTRRLLTGTAAFGIDVAGNNRVAESNLAVYHMDDLTGTVATDALSTHDGSYHGATLGDPEVVATDGRRLINGYSVALDGIASYVDVSPATAVFTAATKATLSGYFKIAPPIVPPANLLEVADIANTTGTSIDFTTFLSTYAYPNRPLATDNGDPIDHSELAGYKNANVTVDGGTGQLVLTATHTSMTDYLSNARTYTSGLVQTGGDVPTTLPAGFQFTYGHVEIDFKLNFLGGPTGIVGLTPGIRLSPRNGDQFPYPPEIDIMQMFGANVLSTQIHLGDIVGDPTSTHYDNAYTTILDPTSSFHTVSLDWTSEHLIFSLNGATVGVYAGGNIPSMPLFLTINLGVGGSRTTTPNPTDFASGGAELRISRILVTP